MGVHTGNDMVSDLSFSVCVFYRYISAVRSTVNYWMVNNFVIWKLFLFQAAMESIVSAAFVGIAWAFFSGQPLIIMGSTGPVLVFESIVTMACQYDSRRFFRRSLCTFSSKFFFQFILVAFFGIFFQYVWAGISPCPFLDRPVDRAVPVHHGGHRRVLPRPLHYAFHRGALP